MLSDADCDSLDEAELDERVGVTCRVGPASAGRRFSTLVDGTWVDVNAPIDFNKNKHIEESQSSSGGRARGAGGRGGEECAARARCDA